MEEKALQIVLKAKDDASKTLKSFGGQIEDVEKKASNFSKTMKVVGGAMTAVGVAGVMAMKDWMQKAADAEVEMARFEATMTANFGKAPKLFREVRDAALETSKAFIKLGFDDEETANSFARLAAQTRDATEAKKYLAIAADLARYKSIGLSEATQALTLALMGNTRILKQMGIEVDENASKEQILDQIQQRVAGQAENYSRTYAGAMARMKVETDNLKEALGERLLPIVTENISKLTDLVEKLNNINPKVLDMAVKVTALVTALGLIAGPITFFIGAVKGIAVAVAGVIGGLSLSAIAIGALVVALVGGAIWVITHWEQVKNFFINAWNVIVAKFNEAKAWLGGAIEGIIEWFGLLPERIGQFLYDLAYIKIPFAIGFIAGWLTTTIPTLINSVIDWFKQLPDRISELLEAAKNWIIGKFTEAWTWISTNLPTWPDKVKAFIKGIPDKVKEVFEDAKNAAINKMKELWEGVTSWWEKVKGVIEGIKKAAEDAIGAVKRGFEAGKQAGIRAYQHGGFVPVTGPALLHAGEFVLSKDMLSGRQPIPAPVTNYSAPVSIGPVYVNDMADVDTLAHRLAFLLKTSGGL